MSRRVAACAALLALAACGALSYAELGAAFRRQVDQRFPRGGPRGSVPGGDDPARLLERPAAAATPAAESGSSWWRSRYG